jgi:hypothetical protein
MVPVLGGINGRNRTTWRRDVITNVSPVPWPGPGLVAAGVRRLARPANPAMCIVVQCALVFVCASVCRRWCAPTQPRPDRPWFATLPVSHADGLLVFLFKHCVVAGIGW